MNVTRDSFKIFCDKVTDMIFLYKLRKVEFSEYV